MNRIQQKHETDQHSILRFLSQCKLLMLTK